MNNTKSILLLCFSFISTFLFAQEEVPMADTMRSEGKIYVVVAVVLVLVLGLVLYVFLMDKKITALEKRINKKG
ncbi:MAG: CcmD family protein [Azospira oryzae]|nr:MAG: CcmD family protein [Azospira oryzae]